MPKTASKLDIQDLRQAIPKHCFESSLKTSLYYLARDVSLVIGLAVVGNHIPSIPSLPIRILAWTLYGYVQGLLFTGIWIIAHECGHGSFSPNETLNNCIGWFLHSFLMVPYFSWKMSHQHHHMYHAHMDKDTAHVPPRREDVKVHHNEHEDITEDAPLRSIFQLLVHQLLGFQLYFLFFITAGKKSYKQDNKPKWYNQSHLDPWSVAFRADKWRLVVISDLGLLLTFAAIRFAASHIGWQAVMLLYGVPYVWVNHWIVAITLLHHSHPNVPRYEDDAWTFLDGALSTVDRDFGWIGKHVFHNIIDFHVIHHLFPKIPFYHAVEATEAIKPILGDRFIKEKGSFLLDLWSSFRNLRWMEARKNPVGKGTIRVWSKR